jgi:hypothetical protein
MLRQRQQFALFGNNIIHQHAGCSRLASCRENFLTWGAIEPAWKEGEQYAITNIEARASLAYSLHFTGGIRKRDQRAVCCCGPLKHIEIAMIQRGSANLHEHLSRSSMWLFQFSFL